MLESYIENTSPEAVLQVGGDIREKIILLYNNEGEFVLYQDACQCM